MSFLCGNALASKTLAERPSPHKLALIVLIKLYAEPGDNATELPAVAELSQAATQQLSRFLHLQVHATDRAVESENLAELHDALRRAVPDPAGHELSFCLQSYMATACKSPDDLLDIIVDIEHNLLQPRNGTLSATERESPGARVRPTAIGRSSPFGLFIRRIVLSVNMGHFSALSSLYDRTLLYAAPPAASAGTGGSPQGVRAKNGALFLLTASAFGDEAGAPLGDSRILPGTARLGDSATATLSPMQLQMLVHDAALRLERSIGSISFDAVEQNVQALLGLEPDLPRAFWIRFLNCTLHRNQQAAASALHRYFDYAIRLGGPNASAGEDRRRGSGGGGAYGHDGRERQDPIRIQERVAQYAVLNKAGLHWHFGQYAAAAAAVEETVRLAQENGNGHAIALALAWLHQVLAAQRDPKAVHVLRRCADACVEHGIDVHFLQVLVALNLAQTLTVTPSLPGCLSSSHETSMRNQTWASLSTAAATVADAAASVSGLPGQGTTGLGIGGGLAAGGAAGAGADGVLVHSELLLEQGDMLHARRQLVLSAVCAANGHGRLAALGGMSLLQNYSSSAGAIDIALAMARLAHCQVLL
jgi:hypothetical protein